LARHRPRLLHISTATEVKDTTDKAIHGIAGERQGRAYGWAWHQVDARTMDFVTPNNARARESMLP
jgi:hypothetical protein